MLASPKFSVEGLEVCNNSTTTVKKKCLVAPDCSPYEHVTSQCLIGSAEVVERAESSTETSTLMPVVSTVSISTIISTRYHYLYLFGPLMPIAYSELTGTG
jgi:hypothetical protein